MTEHTYSRPGSRHPPQSSTILSLDDRSSISITAFITPLKLETRLVSAAARSDKSTHSFVIEAIERTGEFTGRKTCTPGSTGLQAERDRRRPSRIWPILSGTPKMRAAT